MSHYTIYDADTAALNTSLQPVAASVATGVTVTTNNDKTGYSLTQAFPANFAALGITSAGKISEVVLCDTLTTYTGNVPQTGDAYARIGAAGAGLTAVGLATAGLDSVVIETGLDARRALGINAAALAGVLGISGTTVSIAAAGVPATNRIMATVDAAGERTAVTLNPHP